MCAGHELPPGWWESLILGAVHAQCSPQQTVLTHAGRAALRMPANLENSAVATALVKASFHSNPKERQCQECSNYCTIALISHASKVMLKILQAKLQQYVNHEHPGVQAGFRKGKEPEIKLPTSAGSSKKQESSRKTSISALLTMPKPLTVWIRINSEKF